MLKRWIIFSAYGFILASCQTVPKRWNDVAEGNWHAKALIKDIEGSRSYIVNLNFNIRRGDATRMDVTTTLGTGVSSLLLDSKEVRYILFEAKKLYFGAPQVGVMRPILSVPFDPRWINNVLLDLPIEQKGWTCARDGKGWLTNCEDVSTGLKIVWSGRNGDKKTIVIANAKASVQINVQSFKTKVEDRKNLFTLEAPEGYQKLHIR